MPPRDQGPYMTDVWRVLPIPALLIPNFTVGRMMCLHYFLFSVMDGKGYLIVWGIFELKNFHAFFC